MKINNTNDSDNIMPESEDNIKIEDEMIDACIQYKKNFQKLKDTKFVNKCDLLTNQLKEIENFENFDYEIKKKT